MTIRKPEPFESRSSGRGGSSSTRRTPLDNLSFADGKAIVEDKQAPAAPNFSRFADSSHPVEQELYAASKETVTINREWQESGRMSFYANHSRDSGSSTVLTRPENHSAADLAWHQHGSALDALRDVSPKVMDKLMQVDGAKEAVLQNPDALLSQVKRMPKNPVAELADKLGGDRRMQGVVDALSKYASAPATAAVSTSAPQATPAVTTQGTGQAHTRG